MVFLIQVLTIDDGFGDQVTLTVPQNWHQPILVLLEEPLGLVFQVEIDDFRPDSLGLQDRQLLLSEGAEPDAVDMDFALLDGPGEWWGTLPFLKLLADTADIIALYRLRATRVPFLFVCGSIK